MARGPSYRVPYRRRRQAKTDYKVRRTLATSKKPRLVVRPSNKNITVQLLTSKIEGDVVHAQVTSKELDRFGWLGGNKNIPAAYLLGVLVAKKALKVGIDSANLDIGLARPTKGAKVFATLKGALDAGLDIPCDSDILPDPGRTEGKAIADYAKSIEDSGDYERHFSAYLKRGIKPQDLPDHFRSVKDNIMEDTAI